MIVKFQNKKIWAMNYTRIISLPKVWLDTIGLKEGNYLELEMDENGNLILKPIMENKK